MKPVSFDSEVVHQRPISLSGVAILPTRQVDVSAVCRGVIRVSHYIAGLRCAVRSHRFVHVFSELLIKHHVIRLQCGRLDRYDASSPIDKGAASLFILRDRPAVRVKRSNTGAIPDVKAA